MSGKPLRFLGLEIDLSGKKAKDDLADWNREVREALGLSDDYADGVDEMAKEMREYARKVGLTKEQIRELQETARKNRDLGEFAKKYGLSMSEVQQKTRETREAIGGLTDAMGVLAAAGIGAKLLGGAGEMSKLSQKTEDLGVSLKVMLGSAGLAKKTLGEFKEFSDISPFEPGPVNESGLAMLQFGIAAKDVIKSMQMVGDVAAGTNKDFKDLSSLYGKAFALKKVDNEMLQQVPVLYGAIGKVINKTEKDVFDMASKGQISFKIMEQAFKALTSEGGRYYKMMEERSKTTSGVLSTFAGNTDTVKMAVGDMINEGLRPLADFGNQVLGWLIKTPWAMNILKGAILALTPVAAIFFASVLFKAIKTLNLLNAETLKFGIRIVIAFLPVYAIIAVILALILIFEDLYTFFTGGDSVLGKWVVKMVITFLKVKAYIYGIITDIIVFFKSIPDKIVSFFKSIPDRIMSVLGKLKDIIKGALIGMLPNWAVTLIGKIKNDGGEKIEPRAGGGDIIAGKTYWVGEKGPELFTSSKPGTIIPNNALKGGGKSTNITIAPVFNISGAADPESIASYVMKKIEDSISLIQAELGLEVS